MYIITSILASMQTLKLKNDDDQPLSNICTELLTARTSFGAIRPVCHTLVILVKAGIHDNTKVPDAEHASSNDGSSHVSLPMIA